MTSSGRRAHGRTQQDGADEDVGDDREEDDGGRDEAVDVPRYRPVGERLGPRAVVHVGELGGVAERSPPRPVGRLRPLDHRVTDALSCRVTALSARHRLDADRFPHSDFRYRQTGLHSIP